MVDFTSVKQLERKSDELRSVVFDMVCGARTGHIGSDLSCADILTTLYYKVLNIDPANPEDPNRDRYVQSKGHAVEILWAVLADRGFFDKEELKTFSKFGSRLLGHPNNEVAGIEMNTGSLGHGLGVSTGMAIAAKMDGKDYKVYTLMGDGELAEGSVWEAAMAASHYKLNNLTAIIDNNGLQITGTNNDVMSTAPLNEKFTAFGWHVMEVDGNNIAELIDAFESNSNGDKPKMIIAHTIKGKGFSGAENKANWHHKVPTDDEYLQAKAEFKVRMEAE